MLQTKSKDYLIKEKMYKLKKALIVSCADNYDYNTRTKYVEKYLKDKNFEVEFLVADFDHRNKVKYQSKHDGNISYIHVAPYKKNISVARIFSHIMFANGVKQYVNKNNFDLVYHCAPPNSTIKKLSQSRQKKNFKLITEIGDMWPESMPVSSKIKKGLSIPFNIWAGFRDKYLSNSDAIITECNLFKNKLEKNAKLNNIKTIYFCKEFKDKEALDYNAKQKISLCYLGSINNIIDIDLIGKMIKELCKDTKVDLHIIGDGENRQELIDTAKKSGAEVFFHGIIYDKDKKQEIFNQCHFGLNIMKPTVFVGMTMKSLDYFSYGLPIINNIGGDVWEMVKNENIGINVEEKSDLETFFNLKQEHYKEMIENVKDTHSKNFSIEHFEMELNELLDCAVIKID